jgi:hypothetical protein
VQRYLSADDREWVERTAARLGPLTGKQRDTIGLLLRKRAGSACQAKPL